MYCMFEECQFKGTITGDCLVFITTESSADIPEDIYCEYGKS